MAEPNWDALMGFTPSVGREYMNMDWLQNTQDGRNTYARYLKSGGPAFNGVATPDFMAPAVQQQYAQIEQERAKTEKIAQPYQNGANDGQLQSAGVIPTPPAPTGNDTGAMRPAPASYNLSAIQGQPPGFAAVAPPSSPLPANGAGTSSGATSAPSTGTPSTGSWGSFNSGSSLPKPGGMPNFAGTAPISTPPQFNLAGSGGNAPSFAPTTAPGTKAVATALPQWAAKTDAPKFGDVAITGPTSWNVGANQTVAHQLAGIMANDSPLMQQARTRAMQQMQGRGLVNSSMGATAGESAMLDRAMPIAQADASMYGDAARFNADASNQALAAANAFARDQAMATFNLSANDWASNNNFRRGEASADNAFGRSDLANSNAYLRGEASADTALSRGDWAADRAFGRGEAGADARARREDWADINRFGRTEAGADSAAKRSDFAAERQYGRDQYGADAAYDRSQAGAERQLGRDQTTATAAARLQEARDRLNADLQGTRDTNVAGLNSGVNKDAAKTEEDNTVKKGYINGISQARRDYATALTNISESSTMTSEVKAETLSNLRTTYNTMITNYAGMLGWDKDSWLIKTDAADDKAAADDEAGGDPASTPSSKPGTAPSSAPYDWNP